MKGEPSLFTCNLWTSGKNKPCVRYLTSPRRTVSEGTHKFVYNLCNAALPENMGLKEGGGVWVG